MELKKTEKKQEIQIISKPPTLSVDGNSVFITDQGYGDITFIQVVNRNEDVIQAIGVASVRLPLDQLKSFNESLTSAIKDHEEKMSKQAQAKEKEEAPTQR